MVKKEFSQNTKSNLPGFFSVHKRRLIGFFLVAFLLFLFPSPNIYFQSVPKTTGVELSANFDLPKNPLLPIDNHTGQVPAIAAAGVLIKDIPSGMVLYAKNERVKFPPASTTKIMTALISLEKYHLDDVMTVKTIVNDGKKMGLVLGEQITVESLLYGALVHSANDAAYVLAENYPGGVAKFVEKMNEKAKQLNLSETHFANPIGFDDVNQYTTARDLAKLAQIALTDKIFSKIVGTKSITVSDVNFYNFHDLKNVNELLGKVAGVSGVKTGFTENAGEILVSEVKKQDRTVLFVVLKSGDRFGDTTRLIDWVFSNFTWVPIEKLIPTTGSL